MKKILRVLLNPIIVASLLGVAFVSYMTWENPCPVTILNNIFGHFAGGVLFLAVCYGGSVLIWIIVRVGILYDDWYEKHFK